MYVCSGGALELMLSYSMHVVVIVVPCCSFLDDAFRKNLESALRFGNPLFVQVRWSGLMGGAGVIRG